jgi:uncharacterized protein (TIGR03790 family)
MTRRPLILVLLALVAPALLPARAPAALGPDNLLLLTNRNVPDGRKLADYYATKRQLPPGRILELDLPAGDDVSFADYETKVVPVVRAFLAKHDLRGRVTCLVPFYGVPLKIAARVNTPADTAELAAVQRDLAAAVDQFAAAVEQLEAVARELEPALPAIPDRAVNVLVVRDRRARDVVARNANLIDDPKRFEALMSRSEQAVAPLEGPAHRAQRRMHAIAAAGDRMTPTQFQEATKIKAGLLAMRAKFDDLQARRADPAAREQLRALVKAELGVSDHAQLLQGMADYFATDATDAAFDSELALVDWNFPARTRWVGNPLHFRGGAARAAGPPAYMTVRLDGPQAGTVVQIVAASLKAEAEGLAGKAVIDAGGHLAIDPKNAGYSAFDQNLRNVAETIRTKTQIPLVLDTQREVLPARSVQEPAAIYCGWYALQNYTPACTFAPGAVGYHVASYDLTTLRGGGDANRQWGRGLLSDGVAATLGAVNEPFLSAFPPPDEFFPLLFTGQLTLAEVYWKTAPTASWRIAIVGDPLYNPYKAKPAIKLGDLSPALRNALATTAGPATTAPTPATRPAPR